MSPMPLRRYLRRAISFATSLVGLLIVIVGISTQPVMSLFFGSISSTAAWIISLGVVYYVNSVGYGGWYVVGFCLLCTVCGVIGSPIYLIQGLFRQKEPEPEVKMIKKTAKIRKKKGWAAKLEQSLLRIPFRFILVILAIVDTVIHTTILEEGASKKSYFWKHLFEKKEDYYDYEEVYGGEVQNDYPEELWIHINGILNELEDAKGTCKEMYEMFGRPVKLLHNPTDGALLDLLECMMGKTGLLRHGSTGPRKKLKKILGKEMKKGYKKIVLVAHSQGTIITGNVIADFNDIIDDVEGHTLKEREVVKENLSKVEVYLLAGAAHYVSGKYVSRLECISNRGDFVAILGHLFPKVLRPIWRNTWNQGIRFEYCIDHVEKSNWGHSAKGHYLDPMKEGMFPGSKLVTDYLLKKPQKMNQQSETSSLLSK